MEGGSERESMPNDLDEREVLDQHATHHASVSFSFDLRFSYFISERGGLDRFLRHISWYRSRFNPGKVRRSVWRQNETPSARSVLRSRWLFLMVLASLSEDDSI